MKTTINIFLVFAIFATLLFQFPSQIFAATTTCSSVTPNTIPQGTNNISFEVTIQSATNGEYRAEFNRGSKYFNISGGKGSVTFKNPNKQEDFPLVIYEGGMRFASEEVCLTNIKIIPPQANSCTISITSEKLHPGTNIGFRANGLKDGKYGIFADGVRKKYYDFTSVKTFSIDSLKTGPHTVEIRSCDPTSIICTTLECPAVSFTVGTYDKPTSPTTGTVPTGMDVAGNLSGNCGSDKISTAIGCIPIGDPSKTIGWFLSWFIGISGGIAFLLIVYGAIQMMTASGDPQKLQGGREVLTAAISGLIFIIFSVFLLNLIGVKILQLPGF